MSSYITKSKTNELTYNLAYQVKQLYKIFWNVITDLYEMAYKRIK